MKILITIFLLLISVQLRAPVAKQLYILKSDYECNQLTWDNIDFCLRANDVKHPEIVTAQIRHETGSLKSRFCRECNNLFGMRPAKKRPTTAVGRDNNMSVYLRWQDSIEDYKTWQDKYYRGGDYYLFLKKHGYATDKHYIKKLKSYMR